LELQGAKLNEVAKVQKSGYQVRQKKLASVEMRLKRLKSTEAFSTCATTAPGLNSTA